MTNEPILKNAKMNITKVTTINYINSPLVGQKKTNPFLVASKLHAKTDTQTLRSLGEGGQTHLPTKKALAELGE
jgi:hypothetical protein